MPTWLHYVIADLNEALKEELQRLRAQSTRLGAMAAGNPSSFGGIFNQLASQLAMQQLSNSAPQQPQHQPQVGMPPPPSGQNHPNFMDFNQQK